VGVVGTWQVAGGRVSAGWLKQEAALIAAEQKATCQKQSPEPAHSQPPHPSPLPHPPKPSPHLVLPEHLPVQRGLPEDLPRRRQLAAIHGEHYGRTARVGESARPARLTGQTGVLRRATRTPESQNPHRRGLACVIKSDAGHKWHAFCQPLL